MGLTLADSYYLKAKGAMNGWCSDWEDVCEALNYALSYDENHCASLCLLGKIYAEYLSMPKEAFTCFDKVIAIDTNYEEVYPIYVKNLIINNEMNRAIKLISFSQSIKTIDKAQMYWLSSYLNETQGNYKVCLEALKDAKRHCYNDYYFNFMNDEDKRIKKKIELEKPKKKKKKAKKEKSKKKNK